MSEFIRSNPIELAGRIARNPATILRIPKKATDIFKWRKINQLLDGYQAIHPDIVFVQIGANDGVRGDPLHKRIIGGGWTGILVEPVPEHIHEARKNYAYTKGIEFVQAAIADTDGTQTMYRFRHENYGGMGIESHSLEKSAILASAKLLGIKATDECVEKITVPTMTLPSLLSNNGLVAIDLLAIDAEGSDETILNTLLDTDVRPALILYENLFMNKNSHSRINDMFKSESYEAINTSQDTLLYKI